MTTPNTSPALTARPRLSLPQAHKGGACHVVRYDTHGRYLLSGGADRTVKLWNASATSSGEAVQPIKTYSSGHSHEILALDVTKDNARFASGGPDKAVLLWDVPTSTVLRRFSAHTGAIYDVRFAGPGGGEAGSGGGDQVLCTAGYDGILRFYDLRAAGAWRPILESKDARDAIQTICFDSARSTIWTGSVDGCVRCYDVRKGTLTQDTVDEPVVSLSLASGGQLVLVSTSDSTHRLFDAGDGSLLQSFKGHKNERYRCHSAVTRPTEDRVVGGDEEGCLRVWDLLSGKVVQTLSVGEDSATPRSARSKAILWTECNPRAQGPLEVVTGGADGGVHIWSSAAA